MLIGSNSSISYEPLRPFRMKKESKFAIMGLIAGAAVGAAVGILFAPQSGKTTRKEIKRKAKKASKEMREQLEQIRGSAGNTAADILEEVGDNVSAKAKRAAETVRPSSN